MPGLRDAVVGKSVREPSSRLHSAGRGQTMRLRNFGGYQSWERGLGGWGGGSHRFSESAQKPVEDGALGKAVGVEGRLQAAMTL